MSKSKLVLYHAGFKSHLKFDENKENLESENSTFEPLENLILADLEPVIDEGFEIRNAYLGWCSLFLHAIRNQKCELYNLAYNSVAKTQTLKTNCKLADPFDLKSLKCNNNETYLVCNDRRVTCISEIQFCNLIVALCIYFTIFLISIYLSCHPSSGEMLAKKQLLERTDRSRRSDGRFE